MSQTFSLLCEVHGDTKEHVSLCSTRGTCNQRIAPPCVRGRTQFQEQILQAEILEHALVTEFLVSTHYAVIIRKFSWLVYIVHIRVSRPALNFFPLFQTGVGTKLLYSILSIVSMASHTELYKGVELLYIQSRSSM